MKKKDLIISWIGENETFKLKGNDWGRGTVCESQLKDGATIFHDGCTKQMPGKSPQDTPWGQFFHEACVAHDHCFHHNPSTYDTDNQACDAGFFHSMLAKCTIASKNAIQEKECFGIAGSMWAGVRAPGKTYYNKFNEYAEYRYQGNYSLPNGAVLFKNKENNKCLTPNGEENGRIAFKNCQKEKNNNYWSLDKLAYNEYRIKNAATGTCVTVGNNAGDHATHSKCDNTNLKQRFSKSSDGSTYRLKLKNSSVCLVPSNWNELMAWNCWDNPDMRFTHTYKPLGHWTFNNTTKDFYGFADGKFHGSSKVPYSSEAPGTDNSNRSISFNGSNRYISIENNKHFQGMTSFTLEAMIYPRAEKSQNVIISKGSDFILQLTTGNKLLASVKVDGRILSCKSDKDIPIYEWNKVAGVWTGSSWKLYKNGSNIKTCHLGKHKTKWNSASMTFGSKGQSSYFNGYIDDIRIYNTDVYASNGPIMAHWPFENNSPKDASGSGNDGQIKNYNYYPSQKGRIGSAFSFGNHGNANGKGYVKINNAGQIDKLDRFSVSAWVKPTKYTSQSTVISKGYPVQDFTIQLNYGTVIAQHENGSLLKCKTSKKAPLDQWTHITATWENYYDGGNWRIYLNGKLEKSCYMSKRPLWKGSKLSIGSTQEGYQIFNGQIDEVKIFNKKLTSREVEEYYKTPSHTITY